MRWIISCAVVTGVSDLCGNITFRRLKRNKKVQYCGLTVILRNIIHAYAVLLYISLACHKFLCYWSALVMQRRTVTPRCHFQASKVTSSCHITHVTDDIGLWAVGWLISGLIKRSGQHICTMMSSVSGCVVRISPPFTARCCVYPSVICYYAVIVLWHASIIVYGGQRRFVPAQLPQTYLHFCSNYALTPVACSCVILMMAFLTIKRVLAARHKRTDATRKHTA